MTEIETPDVVDEVVGPAYSTPGGKQTVILRRTLTSMIRGERPIMFSESDLPRYIDALTYFGGAYNYYKRWTPWIDDQDVDDDAPLSVQIEQSLDGYMLADTFARAAVYEEKLRGLGVNPDTLVYW